MKQKLDQCSAMLSAEYTHRKEHMGHARILHWMKLHKCHIHFGWKYYNKWAIQ